MITPLPLDAFFEEPPYELRRPQRQPLFLERMSWLTHHHMQHCPPYKKMMAFFPDQTEKHSSLEHIPFLPVRLFKELDLKSVPQSQVQKTLLSSGTTGHTRSRIALDHAEIMRQTKVLAHITVNFTGLERMPMLVIDSQSAERGADASSARAAATTGFSLFGRPIIYALDKQGVTDLNALKDFETRYGNQPVFVFGLTFLVFSKFLKCLEEQGIRLDLGKGILIHGGGWKKMADQQISAGAFRALAEKTTGIRSVHNYYGLVEQTGSIFLECEQHHLHPSLFSDVLVRNAHLEPCVSNERGLLQVFSALPESYPGHSLLTEDEATILGEDDCPCGRKGKYFVVHGRVQDAEARGCSDTLA